MSKSRDLNAQRGGRAVKKFVLGTVLAGAWVSVGMAQSAPKSPSTATATPATTSTTNASPSQRDFVLFGRGTPGYLAFFSSQFKLTNSSLFSAPSGDVGIGTNAPDTLFRVINSNYPQSGSAEQPYAIFATLSNIDTDFSAAIRGDSLAPTGAGNGVIGLTSSSAGAGILGVSVANEGGYGVLGSLNSAVGGGGGVLGVTQATSGFSTGIRGNANAPSGGAVAIYAEQFSPEATAGQFINRAGGPILIGGAGSPDVNVFRVDGKGTVYANGGFQPNGADFAESMAVSGNPANYFAGDLLTIDSSSNRRLVLAQTPYSTLVAGIYSTKPGMLGSLHMVDESIPNEEIPLAVVGVVPCKVSAENGPIRRGDLLVTSSTPGHAMKGTDRARMLGAVVGKALEPLQEGTGVIQVLVTLQ